MWTAHCDVLQDHHSLTDREVRYLERRWLKEVFKAKEYLKTLQFRPPILVDPAPLRSRAEHLASHRRLAHRVRHVLAWTLNEVSRKVAPQGDTYGSHLGSQMVEDLTSLADAVRRDSLFPHQALRVGSLFCVCLSLESECYWNMALQDYLPSLIERLRDRDRAFILMDPRKKKILFKLLALRSWIGDRPIRHLPLAVAEAVAEGRSLPRISSPLDKQVSWISHCGSHTVTLTRSLPMQSQGLQSLSPEEMVTISRITIQEINEMTPNRLVVVTNGIIQGLEEKRYGFESLGSAALEQWRKTFNNWYVRLISPS